MKDDEVRRVVKVVNEFRDSMKLFLKKFLPKPILKF